MEIEIKREKHERRHKRVRAKIFGTVHIPRLCVFRSNKHIYGQLIDDEKGKILVSVSDLELKKPKIKDQKLKTEIKKKKIVKKPENPKIVYAYEVGKLIAKKALAKKIKKVVFDRRGYKYHGRVKAVADGARREGLKF